jgi:hypothetical protein
MRAMGKATMLLFVTTLALGAPACSRKPGENPRCRIFEESVPAQPDRATLEQLQDAYDDMARIAECAKAASLSVEEFMERHQVRKKIEDVARQVGSAVTTTAETVVDQARQTVEQVREGAQQAIDESADRIEQGIQFATGQ